jgi:hypothetical protein
MNSYPEWLHFLSWAYLVVCIACAFAIAMDLFWHRQKMWIMNLVWPITGLYLGPAAVWLYLRTRAVSLPDSPQPKGEVKEAMMKMEPTREQTSVAVCHCGAGCTLGDIIGEAGLFTIGGSLTMFVAGSEFATKLVTDFVLAYVLGIFFQYFTIVPMRGLSVGEGLAAAVRADTISIVAFQIGMSAWMALTRFAFFPGPHRIYPNMAVYWFMMQIAMVLGWLSSYPANVWLLRKGWKEKMPMYPSRQVMNEHRLPPKAA